MNSLGGFLDKRFAGAVRVPLGRLIERTKHGSIMQAGTLVIMASGDRKLRLRILQRDTPHKGLSEPLRLNPYAREHRVTANYVLWYLGQEPVGEYLLAHASGSVFLRVPKTILYAVPVPLPKRGARPKGAKEVVLEQSDDSLSSLVGTLYHDYRLNLDNGRYRTAIIIAGAIAELIIYQLLLESGVSSRLLASDRNLTLGKMLDYVQLLKLDQGTRLPLSHLRELQRKRNRAVHANLLVTTGGEFSFEDLACFDQVIKHFGV